MVPLSPSPPSIDLDIIGDLVSDPSSLASDIQLEVLRLFDACAPGLRRYVRSCGLPPDAADDVVQETFLALFRHLRAGGQTQNLRGWLVRVGYRLALKHREKLARRQGVEVAIDDSWFDPVDPVADPESRMAARQRRRRVSAVIQALPERERQCLWMRAEGVTYREIAAALDISLGAVAKAVARAVARLTCVVKEI